MRRRLLLLVGAFASFSLGCQRDAEIGEAETEESGRTETDTISDESTDTQTETESDEGQSFVPDDETETETGEPVEPKSCREMLDCVFMCLTDLGLECLQACGEGFDVGEAQKAGELVLCLGQQCIDKGQCEEFTSQECIGCLGLGLFLPKPPGCEEQAMACE